MKLYDTAIIGAGVVGSMIARELSRYDLKVCVLEKQNDAACGATKANSAIVHAGFDAKPGTLKAKLNVLGSELMEQTAKELGVKYKNNGALVIGFNDGDYEKISKLYEQGLKNGVKNLKIINSDELHKLEPKLSEKAVCALYAPTSSIVCPYELCIAALGNAMDNGAEFIRNFEVKSIEKKNGCYEIKSENSSVCAKYVVNAAGLYADSIANMVSSCGFTIHPRRGEYILLDKECGNLTERTIFRTPTDKGKGILLSPTVDGNFLTGPTATDCEDKADKSTTNSGLLLVMSQARENLPGIPFGKTITSFCGLRAVGSTGDFIINAANDNFINVAGIESPGLSASPAIAKYVADMLEQHGLELTPKKDFNPIRKPSHYFREASIEEKNEVIKKDPSYGRIICRCEGISEGEIKAAIHENPGAVDLDGIKRRTRAGMGRCQSGFCLPYTAEILARELNIPFESVTKSGGDSKIVLGKTKEDK